MSPFGRVAGAVPGTGAGAESPSVVSAVAEISASGSMESTIRTARINDAIFLKFIFLLLSNLCVDTFDAEGRLLLDHGPIEPPSPGRNPMGVGNNQFFTVCCRGLPKKIAKKCPPSLNFFGSFIV
jgi:hypothetical protein